MIFFPLALVLCVGVAWIVGFTSSACYAVASYGCMVHEVLHSLIAGTIQVPTRHKAVPVRSSLGCRPHCIGNASATPTMSAWLERLCCDG